MLMIFTAALPGGGFPVGKVTFVKGFDDFVQRIFIAAARASTAQNRILRVQFGFTVVQANLHIQLGMLQATTIPLTLSEKPSRQFFKFASSYEWLPSRVFRVKREVL